MNSHIKAILVEVATKHNTTVADILSQSRHREHVNARHEAFYRIHEERGYSAERIAEVFGREPSAVRYAVSRYAVLNNEPTRLTLDYFHMKLGWATANNAKRREARLANVI